MAEKKKDPTPAAETAPRRGFFAVFAEVDEVTGSGDLDNLELKDGANKFRVLGEPMLIRKHWDLPASSELTVLPCRKFISDIPAYLKDPEGYLASLGPCEGCEMEAEYGNAVLGKDKGFYNVKDHWVFNVAQDGKPKVAEFHQKSILRGISNFENDPEWLPLMPNGLQDREIIVTKGLGANKKVTYTVGGSPTSGPLDAEELDKLRKKAVDIAVLKMPPAFDDDGDTKWAELMLKAKPPKEGEKPKKAG